MDADAADPTRSAREGHRPDDGHGDPGSVVDRGTTDGHGPGGDGGRPAGRRGDDAGDAARRRRRAAEARAKVAAGEKKPDERQVSAGRWLAETAVILGVAVVVALLVRTFVAQPFWIPSESMTHTLEVQDRVLVYQLAYQLGEVHRGDVVVFARPKGESPAAPKELIKRVIGVEGDSVAMVHGQLTVNGQAQQEPYVNLSAGPGPDFATVKVPTHHIWVMGDNRGNSSDSRVFGTVDLATVEGKAVARILPLSRVGGL